MPQSYRIFSGSASIIIEDILAPKQRSEFYIAPTDEELKSLSVEVTQAVSDMENGAVEQIIINTAAPQEAFEMVKSHYQLFLQAAGGLVFDPEGRMLFMHRLGKWDLPKGKVDPGEVLEQTAVREVEEETGATGLVIERHLVDTYHTYTMFDKTTLKHTAWYQMKSAGGALTPQTEEDIDQVAWLPVEKLPEVLADTYENIKLVIEAYKA